MVSHASFHTRLDFPWLFGCLLVLSGCVHMQPVTVAPQLTPPPRIYAVGYGAEKPHPGFTPSQRKLLAMRTAKLDAIRSLVEEIYGVRLRGQSTVREMVNENDHYRVYVDAFVSQVHLLAINPKGEGIYEAEVELRPEQRAWACLMAPTATCLRDGPGEMPQALVYQPNNSCGFYGCGMAPAPTPSCMTPNCASYPSVTYTTD